MTPSLPPDLDLDQLFRESTPLRIAFLHKPVAKGGAGPLAALVRQRRALALDLLLYAHTVWPLSEKGPIRASGREWARAIGIEGKPGSPAMISRAWTWLEQAKLIKTATEGRIRAIEIRREDGLGRAWSGAFEEEEPFFHIPLAYWRDGFSRDLSLSGKAVLLIGLSLLSDNRPFFELPVERGAAWYGLGPQTVRSGLQELREFGLLRTWVEERDSDQSPIGRTFDRRHSLNSLDKVGAWQVDREIDVFGVEGEQDILY